MRTRTGPRGWSHPAASLARMSRTGVRQRSVYRCTECDAQAPKWLGRCTECGAWSSLVEDRPVTTSAGDVASAGVVMPLAEVDPMTAVGRPTGVPELDRVLGGGLVQGSVTLLGGEPGIGKSTLLLQAMGRMAASGVRSCSCARRSRWSRCACAPAACTRSRRRCSWSPRPRCPRSRTGSGRSRPTCSRSTRSRPSSIPRSHRHPDRWGRCARARTGWCDSRRSARWPRCSSGTSPRTGRSPAHARSSTSSTPCSRSRVIGTTRCGCCTR